MPRFRTAYANTPAALGLLAVATLFAAMALTRLHGFAFSNDEGTYLMWARLANQGYELYADVWCDQPPLIIWALQAAFRIGGESVVTGRVVAVLATTAGLLGIGGVAWLVGGRVAGPAAALALALSPLVNWFGRAVMSDVPANSLAALAVFCALAARRRPAAPGPIAIGLSLTAGVLYGASLLVKPVTLPLAVVFLLVLLLPRQGIRARAVLAAAWGIGCAAVLGLALAAVDTSSALDQIVGTVAGARAGDGSWLTETAERLWAFLAGGHLGIVALGVVGAAWCLRRPSPGRLAMVAWAGLALAAVIIHTPLYEHHLALVLFPMAALAGVGTGRLAEPGPWRAAAAAAAIVFLLALPGAVWGSLRDATPREADSWQMLADLQAVTDPGDWAITDNSILAFRAGLRLPPYLVDTGGKRLRARPEPSETWVRQTAAWQPRAIFFTRSSQLDLAPYLRWVDHTYDLAFRYSSTRRIWTPAAGGPQMDLASQALAPGVVLQGYSLAAPTVTPGGAARLGLVWSTTEPLDEDYQVFTHLLDATGSLVAQHDGLPAGGEAPTSGWQPGAWVLDTHLLTVPADTAPGRYDVEVGLYRLADGQRMGRAIRLPAPLVVAR